MIDFSQYDIERHLPNGINLAKMIADQTEGGQRIEIARNFLQAAGKFHDLESTNILLASIQKPSAQLIATPARWDQAGVQYDPDDAVFLARPVWYGKKDVGEPDNWFPYPVLAVEDTQAPASLHRSPPAPEDAKAVLQGLNRYARRVHAKTPFLPFLAYLPGGMDASVESFQEDPEMLERFRERLSSLAAHHQSWFNDRRKGVWGRVDLYSASNLAANVALRRMGVATEGSLDKDAEELAGYSGDPEQFHNHYTQVGAMSGRLLEAAGVRTAHLSGKNVTWFKRELRAEQKAQTLSPRVS